MKTNQVKLACCLLGWLAFMGIGLISCTEDEPKPEVVENPLDHEIYYIAGKVTDGTNALEGVKVSVSGDEVTTKADGLYQLSVTKKETVGVTFTKSGYVTVSAKAVITADTKKSSVISLVQQMTKTAKPVKVEADKDTTVYDQEKPISILNIPAGAVTQDTEITITEYTDGAKGDSHASLSTINCQPDGQKFEKPVEVIVKNATKPIIYFSEVNHYVEKNGSWQMLAPTTYDKERNVYVSSLTSFSNHSFGFECTATDGESQTEELDKVEIDNLGNMKTKEQTVSSKQKMGWVVDGDLKQQVSSQFAVLDASDVTALAQQVESAIASFKGATAGVSESTFSLGTAKLSGDTKVTVETKARKVTTTIVFRMNYQGQVVNFSVRIVTYKGVVTSITTQYGESHTDHSGSVIS